MRECPGDLLSITRSLCLIPTLSLTSLGARCEDKPQINADRILQHTCLLMLHGLWSTISLLMVTNQQSIRLASRGIICQNLSSFLNRECGCSRRKEGPVYVLDKCTCLAIIPNISVIIRMSTRSPLYPRLITQKTEVAEYMIL